MTKIRIEIFVNPLGNLKMKWLIPSSFALNQEQIHIQLPSYKYDLPKIVGIPVPFSSKASPLEITNILVKSGKKQLKYDLAEDFEGNYLLKIQLIGLNTEELDSKMEISYEVISIVNTDTIYFVFVYPFVNPFLKEVQYDIDVKAKLSYVIRRYKLHEWYFNRETGRKVLREKIFNQKKCGDIFTLNTKNLQLDSQTELNIHVTGTRIPVMIRRDIFWLIIFIIALSILLSPIWSAFIK